MITTKQRVVLIYAGIAAAGILLGAALSGCHGSAPPPVTYAGPGSTVAPAAVAAPTPVIVQQQAAPGGGMGDLLTGAAIGSLATHALTSNRQAQAGPPPAATTTINKTVIHKTTIVQAPPRPAVSLTKPPSVAPARYSMPSTAPKASFPSPSYKAPSSYASTTTTVRYSPSVTARR